MAFWKGAVPETGRWAGGPGERRLRRRELKGRRTDLLKLGLVDGRHGVRWGKRVRGSVERGRGWKEGGPRVMVGRLPASGDEPGPSSLVRPSAEGLTACDKGLSGPFSNGRLAPNSEPNKGGDIGPLVN
jgi:hypothetical protein